MERTQPPPPPRAATAPSAGVLPDLHVAGKKIATARSTSGEDSRPRMAANGGAPGRASSSSIQAGPPPPRGFFGVFVAPLPTTHPPLKKHRRSFVAPTRQADLPPAAVQRPQIPDAGVPPCGGALPPALVVANQNGGSAPPPRQRLLPSLNEPSYLTTPPRYKSKKPPLDLAIAAASESARRCPQVPMFTESPFANAVSWNTASSSSAPPVHYQDFGEERSPTRTAYYDWTPPTADNINDPMLSSQSFVAMLTQDSEADVEVLTQVPISKSAKGQGENYSHNEDIQLCLSWMVITFDPIKGNEQPKATYWKRMAQHFYDNKTFDSNRNVTSLEKRWHIIQKECIRFQECVTRRYFVSVQVEFHLRNMSTLRKKLMMRPKAFL